MAEFKVVIADPTTKKAYQKAVDQKATGIIGKKIGDTVSGDSIGLVGYTLELTGGTDRDGFPMRRDMEGSMRKKILLAHGPGFKPWRKGMRKRKSVRGNTFSDEIAQVNVKVVTAGSKSLEALLGKKEKPAKELAKEQVKDESAKEEKPVEQAKGAQKEEQPAAKPENVNEKAAEEKTHEEKPAEKPVKEEKQAEKVEMKEKTVSPEKPTEGKENTAEKTKKKEE